MKNEILKIINPIHQLSCDDKWKIVDYLKEERVLDRLINYERVDRWWERLTVGEYKVSYVQVGGGHPVPDKEYFQPALITKEMLVCEVEKPKWDIQDASDTLRPEIMEYQQALSKVLVDGFEQSTEDTNVYTSKYIELYFTSKGDVLMMLNNDIEYSGRCAILNDLIYHIEVYNRTAKEPILLNWTENVLKTLI